MKKFIGLTALPIAATLLVACGGGGGSSGDTQERYSISLQSSKLTLPINISNVMAGIGAHAPYTTSLYVRVREGADPAPGATGEDAGAVTCHIGPNVGVGSLTYLDGEDDHYEEIDDGNGNKIKVPKLYRSIVLGTNSGGATFHFHAGDEAGVARVTCNVTDPRDSRVYSSHVDITVGGSTGLPASVRFLAENPGYLGTQYTTDSRLRNNVGINAILMDDANQVVPNLSAPNLQISIVPQAGTAYEGARLISGAVSGSAVQVATVNGVGLISLSSGPNSGVILLSLLADRYDNNVNNGVTDPVTSLIAVPVVERLPDTTTAALSFTTAALTATNGQPFSSVLTAEGGVPPYTWAAAGSLPAGLSLNSSGVISGTPNAPAGAYSVAVTVTDANGTTASGNVTITIAGDQAVAALAIAGCSATDGNTPCKLPDATGGASSNYVYVLTATGGDAATAPAWSIESAPTLGSGVTIGAGTGVLTVASASLAAPAACGTHDIYVRVAKGTNSILRRMQLTVKGGTCP